MDLSSRIGPEDASVLVIAKGGRGQRWDKLERGEEAPREFFYGFLGLGAAGVRAAMMSSDTAMPGLAGSIAAALERVFTGATRLGARPLTARLSGDVLTRSRVVISFTDGFTLSLALAFGGRRQRPVLIGGFQGLTDIEGRVRPGTGAIVRATIGAALRRLDHVFFFGPADRDAAIARYGLAPERTSLFPFGVDTAFWRPVAEVAEERLVVAVGQDANRDFDLLARAPVAAPVRIVTSRRVDVPSEARHVSVVPGGFARSGALSDVELRELYARAAVVCVPLKDVNQPTGTSVTLQAMSCGRPVVLSRIRGLSIADHLVDGENCLLVPPGDAQALGAALTRLVDDADLRRRMGAAAKATVERWFSLAVLDAATLALARRGLDLAAARGHSASAISGSAT